MSKVIVYTVRVEFGDCDPAQIVFYPNFFRWFDSSSRWFFTQCGVPPWRELTPVSGIIGTPLVDAGAKFLRPASYGDTIEVHTSISEWGEKVFAHSHRILRGDTVLVEGWEKRVFARKHPTDPQRIQALPIPPEIRAACA